MPRLGANFFNSYNNQVDRLRRRRSENAEAFNAFVKMRSEMGETASVEDMEAFKRTLAGGDQYFSAALPTKTMMQETASRLGEIKEDKRVGEQRRAINLQNEQLSLVTNTLAGLVDKEANDPAIGEAFNKLGYGNLFTEFGDMIPNLHSKARTDAVNNFAVSTGFDTITTQDGLDVAIAQAPAWAKAGLEKRGKAQISAANNQKVTNAKAAIAKSLPQIVEDAAGNEAALRSALGASLDSMLSGLPPELVATAKQQIIADAIGQMGLDRSNRAAVAVAGVTADETSLLAARNNPAEMRRLAIESLTRNGYTNPDEATIQAAISQLQTQQGVAVELDFEERVGAAITAAQSLSAEELSVIDNEDEVTNKMNDLLASAFGQSWAKMSEDDKAEAYARLNPIIDSRSKAVNEFELEADIEKVFGLIMNDAEIKALAEGGASAEKMSSVYQRINSIRRSNGLGELSEDAIAALYGDTIEGIMRKGAGVRFNNRQIQITKSVSDTIDGINANQDSMMQGLAGQLPEGGWRTITQVISQNYLVPANILPQLQDQLAVMSQQDAPKTLTEQIDMANRLARSMGLYDRATGRKLMIAQGISNEDLIYPGTRAEEFVSGEAVMLQTKVDALIAKIELMPADKVDEVERMIAQGNKLIEQWLSKMTDNLQDPDVYHLLADFETGSMLGLTSTKMADIAGKLNQAAPQGVFSFFVATGGNYLVPQTGPLAQAAQAAGFQPGAVYQKNPQGGYSIVVQNNQGGGSGSGRNRARTGSGNVPTNP